MLTRCHPYQGNTGFYIVHDSLIDNVPQPPQPVIQGHGTEAVGLTAKSRHAGAEYTRRCSRDQGDSESYCRNSNDDISKEHTIQYLGYMCFYLATRQ